MVKKIPVLLFGIATILLVAACQGSAESSGGNADPGPTQSPAGSVVSPPPEQDTQSTPVVEESTPGMAVSDFFAYLAHGNVRAADGMLVYSNGGFANMAEDMYLELGTFVFYNISYRGLEYTVNGNRATTSFTMVNNDFGLAAYEAGFAIGQAGLVNPEDPNFEEALEELLLPIVAEMIIDGTAPTFEMDFTVNLRLVGDSWRIVDNDMGFAMALLGIVG